MRALIATAVLSAALLATAAPTTAAGGAVHGTATSHFTGSSTLHDFEGSAPPASFTLEPQSDGSWAAVVEVPVDKLTTDNSTRDRKMREMFHSDQHPTLRAELSHIVPEDVRTSSHLPLRLTIAGVSHDVVSTVRDWRQTESQLEFVAEFDVSLSEFELEAPRALVIVVADTVHVTTEVSLRRE